MEVGRQVGGTGDFVPTLLLLKLFGLYPCLWAFGVHTSRKLAEKRKGEVSMTTAPKCRGQPSNLMSLGAVVENFSSEQHTKPRLAVRSAHKIKRHRDQCLFRSQPAQTAFSPVWGLRKMDQTGA